MSRVGPGPLSDGVTQAHARTDLIDLGPGYPDPDLLPVDLLRGWYDQALRTWGPQALSYGANGGPLPLRAQLAARSGVDPARVVVTGGTSAGLGELAARLAVEDRAVLVETPTYELGRRIFAGHGLRTVPVPGPIDDLDVDELRRAVDRLDRPPALYLIPTFHNPTGRVLPEPRRREVAALAAERGLLVIEDQAYAEVGFGPAPPPVHVLAEDPDSVVGLYSTAKCLGPGLRLGWMVTGARLAAQLADSPVRVSGGGPNHVTALALAVGCGSGELDRHVAGLREQLRARRDALLAGLGGTLEVIPPAGGFFAWVRLPAETDEEALLADAAAAGMAFAPGHRFGAAAPGARLCFAAQGPAWVAEGARRFAAVVAQRR